MAPASFRARQRGPRFLLDIAGTPTVAAAYSVRRLKATAANKAIQVTRASDSTTQDIGWTGVGNLDTAALATFCSGTTGYVSKWYDQSGNGRDQVQATQANMWRIYAGGVTETNGTNSRAALRAIDNARGMETSSFTAYTGTAMSGFGVAAHTNTVTTLSPRFLGARGVSNTDNSDNSGCVLLGRSGSGTPAATWRTDHNALTLASSGGTYAQLTQLVSAIDNGGGTLDNWVDGTNTHTTGTTGAFNLTIFQIGKATSVSFQSSTDAYISEALFVTGTITTTNRTTVSANQRNYFGTP